MTGQTTISPVQAVSSTSFINSIGVNTHIDSGLPNWENTALVQQEMSYLGVTNVRDGTPYSWALPEYVTLAKMGIKFDLTQENPVAAQMTVADASYDVTRADELQLAIPGSVTSLEGANEYNISSYNLQGSNSYGNLGWGALDDAQLQSDVAGDPILAGVSIIAASTSGAPSLPVIGQYVNASNWHVYAGAGQQLAANMTVGISAAKLSAPGKAVYITEAGVSSSGYGSSFWGVADQYTQGIIDTNAVLDGFNDGAAKTFLYDLMDDSVQASAQENDFGLFTIDGAPKPAAVDISNLIKILQGTGTGSVPLGALAYSISGLPSTASSMLLEKPDGTFDIVVWNGNATLYNGVSDVAPPTSNVTVTFGNSQQVSVFDPVQGTTALQTASNTMSTSFGLSADPIILQVSPALVSALPPAPVTSDTLDLHISEDAWLGNAEFVVSVDGAQVGGVRTASVLHSSGGFQDVSLTGTWGSGAHHVAISFINDAWGGSAATDRNLYVNGISYDGQAATSATVELHSDGTTMFAIAGAPTLASAITPTVTAPAGSISLLLSEDAYLGNAAYSVKVDGTQVGGVGTVTAQNSLGQSQLADVIQNLSPGVHDIAVSFLNDLWGGTSTTDRNLYVKAVDVNGTSVAGTSYELNNNGTHDFIVNVPQN